MSNWQPIETAPKDGLFPEEGTLIDLWTEGGTRIPFCFRDEEQGWIARIRYLDSKGRRITKFNRVKNPTHWRPIPEPPTTEDTPRRSLFEFQIDRLACEMKKIFNEDLEVFFTKSFGDSDKAKRFLQGFYAPALDEDNLRKLFDKALERMTFNLHSAPWPAESAEGGV